MNIETLYIGFEDKQVAVHCTSPELLEAITFSFREMHSADAPHVVGRLEVVQAGSLFRLLKNGAIVDEAEDVEEARRQLRLEIVRAHVEARSDLLWLHAAVAARDGYAVMLSGAYGHGKSTLVTKLCANNWSYLSDDVIPYDPSTGKVLPFPMTPYVRQGVERNLTRDQVSELDRLSFDPPSFCHAPQQLRAIYFPSYQHQAPTAITPSPPAQATLELLQRCFNYKVHQGQAAHYLTRLIERVPAFSLSYSDGDHATEQIIQHLATLDAEDA